MNENTYEILRLSKVKDATVYCNLACKPPLNEKEIEELTNNGYSYATDGHLNIYTIIYSSKEDASLEELESILKINREKFEYNTFFEEFKK
jgi:regulator of sigma D